jgi:Sulfatase
MQVVRRFVFLLVLAQCAGFAATPKGAKRASPTKTKLRNIILITLDTTRADRMGFLGSDRGLTPNLDALAKQSVVFTRAYAQVPLTTPSHAALPTGTYPQFSHLEDLGAPLGKDDESNHRSRIRLLSRVNRQRSSPSPEHRLLQEYLHPLFSISPTTCSVIAVSCSRDGTGSITLDPENAVMSTVKVIANRTAQPGVAHGGSLSLRDQRLLA